MTDDAVFLVAGLPAPMSKAAFEAASAQQGTAAAQFDGQSEIHVLGAWPFMWTHLTVTVTPPGGGKAMKRAGHTLSILRKENGRWRLARDANLLTPVADQ